MTMNLEQHVVKRFKEEIVSYFTTGFEHERKTPLLNDIEISALLDYLDIKYNVRELIKFAEEGNVDIYKVENDYIISGYIRCVIIRSMPLKTDGNNSLALMFS